MFGTKPQCGHTLVTTSRAKHHEAPVRLKKLRVLRDQGNTFLDRQRESACAVELGVRRARNRVERLIPPVDVEQEVGLTRGYRKACDRPEIGGSAWKEPFDGCPAVTLHEGQNFFNGCGCAVDDQDEADLPFSHIQPGNACRQVCAQLRQNPPKFIGRAIQHLGVTQIHQSFDLFFKRFQGRQLYAYKVRYHLDFAANCQLREKDPRAITLFRTGRSPGNAFSALGIA